MVTLKVYWLLFVNYESATRISQWRGGSGSNEHTSVTNVSTISTTSTRNRIDVIANNWHKQSTLTWVWQASSDYNVYHGQHTPGTEAVVPN